MTSADATYLREKAKTCRRLAAGASGKRSPGRRGNYLLELADRFDREAAQLESRFAGSKPFDGDGAAPQQGAEPSAANNARKQG